MKIIYIIDQLYAAGTQHHLRQLVTGLSQKHKIYVICLEEKGSMATRFEKMGTKVKAFNTKAYYTLDSLQKVFALTRHLKKERPDIVQTFLLKANLMGTAAAGMAGIPVILSTRRSMGYDFKPNHVEMLKFVDRNWTSGVLVNSQAIVNVTVAREKVEPNKIHLIYNGIDADRFLLPRDEEQKQKLGIPLNAVVVGIVANIRPVKGLEYLLDALNKVICYQPLTHLLVVGNAYGNREYFRKLNAQVEKLNIQSKITFWQECQNIPQAISLFDIAVVSSNSEGFSNTLLEYMAAQKPIVATRAGGNSEAVINEESGLLVQEKNPMALSGGIIQLMKNQSLTERLIRNARQRVIEKFSLKKMLDRYHQLYQELNGG